MMIFAARRPPVEETASFLNSLLTSHGPNYLEKLFGSKARHRLRALGGVNAVAIALSRKYALNDTHLGDWKRKQKEFCSHSNISQLRL